MSKAFDTVNRKVLLTELQTVLEPDEVHLLGVLTNRPELSIYLDGEKGEGFNTLVGICQGDCLSLQPHPIAEIRQTSNISEGFFYWAILG